MSLSQEQAAFLLDVCKLIEEATLMGFMVTGGELARTPEQQYSDEIKLGSCLSTNADRFLALDAIYSTLE